MTNDEPLVIPFRAGYHRTSDTDRPRDFAPKVREDQFIAPLIPYRLELVNRPQLIERLSALL